MPMLWLVAAATLLAGIAAPAGQLDATWSRDGIAVADFGASDEVAAGVAVMADGRVVVSGYAYPDGAVLARFTAAGRLDTTFGGDGRVVEPMPGGSYYWVVALAGRGTVIAAGHAGDAPHALVARYRADGSLDDSFAGGGRHVFEIGDDDVVTALAVQGDGGIVVTGDANVGTHTYLFVARLTSSGQLDGSFGDGGVVMFDGPLDSWGGGNDVVVANDGRIVVAGQMGNDTVLVSLLPDGSPDPALDDYFHGTGVRVVYPRGHLGDLALRGDGFVATLARNGWFEVIALTATGERDTSFADDGEFVITGLGGGPNAATDVAVQSDGRVLAIGIDPRSDGWQALAVRLLPSGQLDASFGRGGVTRVASATPLHWIAVAVSDTRALVAGHRWSDRRGADILVTALTL